MSLPEASTAPLVITLFGPLSVLVQGHPIPHLRSRKAQWLLALLVLRHGRPVEREWLAGILWPDAEQTLAFANLRPILSELRKALGSESDRLQSPNRHSLLLEMTGAEVDIVAFDAAIASKTLPTLKRAVALYRGLLLEGCNEDWVAQERTGREQACLQALKTLADSSLSTGDYEGAAIYYRRATVLDPLWDAAQRGLMESLDKGGDRNAALQVYREFVGVLQTNNPKAVPAEDTTVLYRRLRDEARRQARTPTPREDAGTAPVVAGYLSYPLTELVGREDECVEVANRLRRSRLVTLTGPGGIGKTRLAVAVAHEVVREYPNGVWLVGLESLPPGSGSGEEERRPIIQQIASVLSIKERSGRPLLPVVVEHLRGRRILLVLDNCEQLSEPCAGVISHLLQGCPGVRILATSRETLRVSGEITWSVPTLAVPDMGHLPAGKTTLVRVLAGYDGVRLFVERAKAVQKTFTLTGDNARDVGWLCSRLVGIPLALELAAARIAILTPAEILTQFDARPLDALVSGQRDTVPRHRTLRATLAWSYGLLPPNARKFLADISVFQGGFTLDAAQAVCPDVDAIEMLTVLRNASLVNTDGSDSSDTRFSLLETVRQYAAERLDESGNVAEVRRRHIAWYAEWIARKIKNDRYFIAIMEREYSNIVTALRWAIEIGDDEQIVKICGSSHLPAFWDATGRRREGRELLDSAVRRVHWERQDPSNGELGSALPSEYQFKLLETQMSFQRATGDWDSAAATGIRIYEIFLRAGQPLGGRTALFHAAQLRMASDLNGTLALLEVCLPLERTASKDGRGNPVILARLAEVTRRVGQLERAAAFLSEALDICRGREDSNPYGYFAALLVAGWTALAESNLAKALDIFETVLVVTRSMPAYLATPALWGMAIVARESGDPQREEALLSEAFAVAGSEPSISQAHYLRKERAEFMLARGDRNGARWLIRETLTPLRGRAHAYRLFTHPLLLLQAEAQEAEGWRPRQATAAAGLLGAAGGIMTRLGLLTPNPAEVRRSARLRAALTECLGPECFAIEEAAGAARDDEGALEFALAIGE